MADPTIKRALISVTDKTGIVEFALALQKEFGIEIVSTGGTATALEAGGVTVRSIDDLTGFPEMMDGRVKTLHPKVHGGLLARRDLESHLEAARQHSIGLIDLVVVNLYAFEATVAKPDVTYQQAIENIDIGGPSMLRSAAKNHASVTVVTRPSSYHEILQELRQNNGASTLATRQRLALQVFQTTSAYDNAIYNWLNIELGASDDSNGSTNDSTNVNISNNINNINNSNNNSSNNNNNSKHAFSEDRRLFLTKAQDLRYGENPHQNAAFYKNPPQNQHCKVNQDWQLANARQCQGKELSYNNYLDLDAAWGAVREFNEPTCVIVKHLTPCGIASNSDITVAYQRAHDCDTVSAYGGVMAFNRPVPAALVEAIYANGQFIEAIIAPAYEVLALELFTQKPNARVLETGGINPAGGMLDWRSVEGGLLALTPDTVTEDPASFTVPTNQQPSPTELDELLFAWKACKSVKSNAILIAADKATVGIGAGQPNRVNSAELATKQAGQKAQGAVAASDAFMPFADSLEVLIAAGVKAVIQPGGSIRDEEVIAAANAANIALVFTGHRHFRH